MVIIRPESNCDVFCADTTIDDKLKLPSIVNGMKPLFFSHLTLEPPYSKISINCLKFLLDREISPVIFALIPFLAIKNNKNRKVVALFPQFRTPGFLLKSPLLHPNTFQ